MNYLRISKMLMAGLIALPMVSCSDNDAPVNDKLNGNSQFGKANEVFAASEWYPGGQLGTDEGMSYSAETPATTNQGLSTNFNKGEDFFEHIYTIADAPRKGLGPAWVRTSCIHCHPGYGHGKWQNQYLGDKFGNGYLLVVYHPTAGTAVDAEGNTYEYKANDYIKEVTGMPQTKAMAPFSAPIDEKQMNIDWIPVSSMPSGLAMKFPKDGEEFKLQYPEVTIPQSAFNTYPKPTNYEVRLESTIGIYGTGLLDAIDEEDMKKVYQQEAKYAELNPGMWDKEKNDWASSAWYTLADGQKKVKKFTYAMTRASLQDGPGANAIWNITNVTRSDRHYLYTTAQWAKYQSEQSKVIEEIKKSGKSETSVLHPYYADGTDEGIKKRVYELLSCNTAKKKNIFEEYLLNGAPYNGEEEMSNKDYYDFMVWHRGLAVPAARNLDNPQVQEGKKLFTQWNCATCHKPSWTTGEDNYWVDNAIKDYAKSIGKNPNEMLPKYPKQTIYPYTDLVQHRLFMANDIRTGWCRTTPLWGRGLSSLLTGRDDRLHDCRARNVVEAIMWHCYDKRSDAYNAALNFYNATKEQRDAVVAFINAI